MSIEATDLSKYYGDIKAVDSLSLDIPHGTIYGFLGPNGAGKTTTMRLFTALTEPTTGTASIAGVPIHDRAALTERIGYLPADPPVFEELTGQEYLYYVARLHELEREQIVERLDSYIERFDLVEDIDRRIEGYSTGMRKKVGIIGAVIHNPEVLFLDEPTSGLDPRAARTMRQMIGELAARDMTVFLSTHILPVVEELADTIGVIHEGTLVAEASPAQLKNRVESEGESDLESAFLELTQERDVPT